MYTTGNAGNDQNRGWFIGQFVDSACGELRSRTDVEIKWGMHPAGDQRANGWSMNKNSTTISILIEGKLVMLIDRDGIEEKISLHERGDYIIFNAGVYHSWYAETESLVLTIRTPSLANDQVHLDRV